MRQITFWALALFAVPLVSGCPRADVEKEPPPEVTVTPPPRPASGIEGSAIRLFYYDTQAIYMVPLTRILPEGEDTASRIFEELAIGPRDNANLIRTIPGDTRLISAEVEGSLLTLDWSGELTSYGGGSILEMGIVLSILNTARQVPGVEMVQMLIDGSAVDYLPEGTGIGKPLPVPTWENDTDPSKEGEKFRAYFVIKGTELVVPIAMSAGDPDDLYGRLTAEETYGGTFDRTTLDMSFTLDVKDEGALKLRFNDPLSGISSERGAISLRALVCTVYSFVESRPAIEGYRVYYGGEEVVTIFDIDVTREGSMEWLGLINREEAA